MALFHFLFELVKIAVLSAGYSGFLVIVGWVFIRIIYGKNQKKYSFRIIFRLIYAFLFIFSFTYYGDHGLGDESAIPIGNGQTMNEGDEFAYFSPNSSKNQIPIDRFIVDDDRLCANSGNQYIIYNLNSNKIMRFNSETLYDSYAENNKLPSPNSFKKFNDWYTDYWNGWRFWLLP